MNGEPNGTVVLHWIDSNGVWIQIVVESGVIYMRMYKSELNVQHVGVYLVDYSAPFTLSHHFCHIQC